MTNANARRNGQDVFGDVIAVYAFIRRRRALRWPLAAICGLLLGTVALVAPLRWIDPVTTTPILMKRLAGEAVDWRFTGLEAIGPTLRRAALVSEDARFCSHRGVDFGEAAAAFRDWRAGDGLRGASTITMQTARSLFLPQSRTMLRKAAELWLTVFIEALWPKARILEIYLNVAEWGPNLYGVEAAAQTAFNRSAANIDRRRAALLITTLPNPKARSPGRPSAIHRRLAGTVAARMRVADWPTIGRCLLSENPHRPG
ncbi:MAG: biosynthetic peptidoglycan transglycosylase [Pseudomonadota bacterium]